MNRIMGTFSVRMVTPVTRQMFPGVLWKTPRDSSGSQIDDAPLTSGSRNEDREGQSKPAELSDHGGPGMPSPHPTGHGLEVVEKIPAVDQSPAPVHLVQGPQERDSHSPEEHEFERRRTRRRGAEHDSIPDSGLSRVLQVRGGPEPVGSTRLLLA